MTHSFFQKLFGAVGAEELARQRRRASEEGHREGFAEGLATGERIGYDRGYRKGHAEGLREGQQARPASPEDVSGFLGQLREIEDILREHYRPPPPAGEDSLAAGVMPAIISLKPVEEAVERLTKAVHEIKELAKDHKELEGLVDQIQAGRRIVGVSVRLAAVAGDKARTINARCDAADVVVLLRKEMNHLRDELDTLQKEVQGLVSSLSMAVSPEPPPADGGRKIRRDVT